MQTANIKMLVKVILVRYLFFACKEGERDVLSLTPSLVVAGQLLNGLCHICQWTDRMMSVQTIYY